ncbi:TRAP-type uncharacterized transport system substrate-binding protein [Agrobacterium tumefaciens]|nr:TRAP-type uncharacterized transport system substrate-binding protein [Agrobacterium radiobacter]MBB4319980.1 TRAP-type uncharacterized transport system substrate-binding protein [Agrobacterium radiobacter]MBB4325209.1 TRAP-type uncharacterized transport system substrate-binding protein [Agrobacterium radiobacter]MBB4336985.1 TRAP-type uncharacterized transport system substrate-binding protein [Agrobacterium radiobacter]MBB4458509.1 TRAP-type uncharacterized transport system substrate-binding
MKTLWKALCAAAMVGMTAFSAHAEEKTITMGTMCFEKAVLFAPRLSRRALMASMITSGSYVASATRVCSIKSGSGMARGSPLL